ncbi:hypothetical protein BH11ACT3_BH11ACT3_12680 [soil metagenome]
MSILTRPIGQRNKQPKAPKGRTVGSELIRARTVTPLSAPPRANLMPPEIGANLRKKAARRGLRAVVVLVLILVLAGVAGAAYLSVSAQLALGSAQQDAANLLAEQKNYSEVQSTLTGIAEGEAALRVAGATDIDWNAYLRQLQATLPGDVTLTVIAVESADAMTPFEQSTVPLEQPRIATLTFTAETTTLPSLPGWIDGLSTMPGFADAQPGSLVYDEGVYTATVTMHIDTDAYSHRFDQVVDGTESTTATEGTNP